MTKQLSTMFISFILSGSMLFTQPAQVSQPNLNESELYAKSAVLMDGESGRVLYGKNSDIVMPMASTTKIMTCILAIENGNLEDEVTVSGYAASMPKVHLGMREKDTYLLKDLLYSLMLESHNDSAVAIAEHIGGSVEGFAKMMNQKARDIGCKNTYFITPNGLDAQVIVENNQGEKSVKNHSTTAEDLARIMKYCITQSDGKELFLKITQTPSYSFTDTTGKKQYSCQNHNAFLNMMDGAVSGKTGFTADAGYCYVGAVERNDKIFIVALLACGWPNNKSYKWSDTKKLMAYGLENYEYQSFQGLTDKNKIPEFITIEDGQTDSLGSIPIAKVTVSETNKRKQLLLGKWEKVEISYKMKEILQAPVKRGDVAGYISYQVNGEVWRTDVVVISEDVKRVDYIWYLKMLWNQYQVKVSS